MKEGRFPEHFFEGPRRRRSFQLALCLRCRRKTGKSQTIPTGSE